MDPSWYLYLGIFIGPFVQEDAAVIAAATLCASDPQHFPVIFFVILTGLFSPTFGNIGLAIPLMPLNGRANGQRKTM